MQLLDAKHMIENEEGHWRKAMSIDSLLIDASDTEDVIPHGNDDKLHPLCFWYAAKWNKYECRAVLIYLFPKRNIA